MATVLQTKVSNFSPTLLIRNHWELKLPFFQSHAKSWTTWYELQRNHHNSSCTDNLHACCYGQSERSLDIFKLQTWKNLSDCPLPAPTPSEGASSWMPRNFLNCLHSETGLIVYSNHYYFSFVSIYLSLIKYLIAFTIGLTLEASWYETQLFNWDDLFSGPRDWFNEIEQSTNSNSELWTFLGKFQRREPWGFKTDLSKMCHFGTWIILSSGNRDPTGSRETTSPPLTTYKDLNWGFFPEKKSYYQNFM